MVCGQITYISTFNRYDNAVCHCLRDSQDDTMVSYTESGGRTSMLGLCDG